MAELKIGVQLQPQHTTFDAYREAWLRADAAGVDSIWNWDHFFPPLWGDRSGPHFEGWTSLATLAVLTKRAQVGCLVLCMSYRNPALLSLMAATLDHATNGRLILGLGAGWVERDYQEYGYHFGTPAERIRQLERGIATIKERWQKDPPGPLRGAMPIMIGGGGEKMTLRIVAQHADLWNTFGRIDSWPRKNQILDEWCAKIGRDPRAIERTAVVREDRLDQVDDLVAAGATHIIYGLGPPYDFSPLEQLLAWREQRRRPAEAGDPR